MPAVAALAVAATLGLAACSGSSGGGATSSSLGPSSSDAGGALVGGSDGGSGGSTDALRAPGARAYGSGASAASGVMDLNGSTDSVEVASSAKGAVPGGPGGSGGASAMQPAIVSTGQVALAARDVEKARFDAEGVASRYGGQVSDQQNLVDDQGRMTSARMTLRVPAEHFEDALDALEKVADLQSSSSTSDDVTTQVVDTAVRIRVQRESIRRIEALLARAQKIGQVVAIESQLSRRQAALNSLLRQQAYLADQTSMSTITVSVQRSTPATRQQAEPDRTGFAAGLSDGWHGLVHGLVAVATFAGLVLPFLVLVLLVGLPVAWLARLVWRRRTPSAVAPPA